MPAGSKQLARHQNAQCNMADSSRHGGSTPAQRIRVLPSCKRSLPPGPFLSPSATHRPIAAFYPWCRPLGSCSCGSGAQAVSRPQLCEGGQRNNGFGRWSEGGCICSRSASARTHGPAVCGAGMWGTALPAVGFYCATAGGICGCYCLEEVRAGVQRKGWGWAAR
jgi:hypothetical protein